MPVDGRQQERGTQDGPALRTQFDLFGYGSILAATLWRGDIGRMLALALFGFSFSLYLPYLELWVIEAICQWCMASATTMTLLFAVCTTRALGYFGLDHEAR